MSFADFMEHPDRPLVDSPRYTGGPVCLFTDKKMVYQMTRHSILALTHLNGQPLIMYFVIPLHIIPGRLQPFPGDAANKDRRPIVCFQLREKNDLLLVLRVDLDAKNRPTWLLEIRDYQTPYLRDLIVVFKDSTPRYLNGYALAGNETYASVLAQDHHRRRQNGFLSIVCLRDKKVIFLTQVKPLEITSLTWLGGHDPCFLTSNLALGCLDFCIMYKQRDGRFNITKTAILRLPRLTPDAKYIHIHCRSLESCDPKIYEGDPDIIVDCRIKHKDSNHELSFSLFVKLKYLKELYDRAMSLSPQVPNSVNFEWKQWGAHEVRVFDTAGYNAYGPNSGHTFTCTTIPQGEEDKIVSVWDLRTLPPAAPRYVGLCAEFPLDRYFSERFVGLPFNCPAKYRVKVPFFASPLGYEGIIAQVEDCHKMIHFLFTPIYPDFERRTSLTVWEYEGIRVLERARRNGTLQELLDSRNEDEEMQ
ncbi:hypothetical protein H0H92_012491 [Tricholoma furcatifolium]|nr:hypothetical protein H0H92_012491 [Tricholoma furcatifolium]